MICIIIEIKNIIDEYLNKNFKWEDWKVYQVILNQKKAGALDKIDLKTKIS